MLPAVLHEARGEISKFFDFNQRQTKVLIYGFLLNFLTFMVGSLLGPFYTIEASNRDLGLTAVGFVFCSSGLFYMVGHPVFGKLFPSINVRAAVFFGNVLSGVFDFLLGAIVVLESKTAFLVWSIVLQGCSALATSAVQTMIYSIYSAEFGDKLSLAQAISNAAIMLAFIVGPMVGGLIFQLFGFFALYALMGLVQIFFAPSIGYMLPKEIRRYQVTDENPVKNKIETLERNLNPEKAAARKDATFFAILCVPNIIFNMLTLFMALLTFFAMVIEVQNYLTDTFGLTAIQIGLTFGTAPVVALIVCIPIGLFTDRCGYKREVIIVGHFLISIMNMLIVPPPIPQIWFYYPGNFYLFLVLIFFHGYAVVSTFVPSLKEILESSFMAGMKQNAATYGMVSGIWAGGMASAKVIGPVIGGVVMQVFNVEIGTLVASCAFIELMLTILWCAYIFFFEDPLDRFENYSRHLRAEAGDSMINDIVQSKPPPNANDGERFEIL